MHASIRFLMHASIRLLAAHIIFLEAVSYYLTCVQKLPPQYTENMVCFIMHLQTLVDQYFYHIAYILSFNMICILMILVEELCHEWIDHTG